MDTAGDAQDITPPTVVVAWLKVLKESLLKSKTSSKDVNELEPLVWDSFTKTFTVDPKTVHELVTLKNGSTTAFIRDLDPELFHWDGTKATVLDLNLLKAFWKTSEVCCL